jgi:hypothetical protein
MHQKKEVSAVGSSFCLFFALPHLARISGHHRAANALCGGLFVWSLRCHIWRESQGITEQQMPCVVVIQLPEGAHAVSVSLLEKITPAPGKLHGKLEGEFSRTSGKLEGEFSRTRAVTER